MLREILFSVILIYSVKSAQIPNGLGWKYVGYGCTGAKDNKYNEVTYAGKDSFIGAVKLVHHSGSVGCNGVGRSNWGCGPAVARDLAMVVTDAKNQILFPAPRFGILNSSGRYKLPGFTSSSPELVFTDFGYPPYVTHGAKLRIWYGEDLYAHTESDNQGSTCYYVYVYVEAA